MNGETRKSDAGSIVLAIVLYVVIWAVLVGLCTGGGDMGPIIGFAICGIVGWGCVTRVQPVMFLWLPIAGWIIYFCIKFIIAVIVGLFVAPYRISAKICGRSNSD